jgi:glycosyltransferase involved in cell wall biosynthesis
MAYGAVVISTNKKLIPMMVSDKNTGCIVPYGKPYAIVDAIQNLINNPNEFESYSKNSMLEYHKKFTADSYCKNVFVVVAGQ